MKKMIMFICFYGILSCFAISSYAAETKVDNVEYESIESILSQFDLSVEDIMTNELAEDVDNVGIDEFTFTSGFDSLNVTTFSSEKTCIGQGEKGMVVGAIIFQDNDGVYDTIFSSIKTLGASGTYSETLNFKPVSEQFVTFIVETDGEVGFITYNVKTIEEATKDILENIELDFSKETNGTLEDRGESETSDDESNSSDTESFMNIFGIKQEIEF